MKKRLVSLIVITVIIATLLPSVIVHATYDGIVSWHGHQYKVLESGMTWTAAEDYCEALGGYLACITDENEQNFVTSLIKDGTSDYYWLGGTNINNEGNWKWVSGEPWNYSCWGEGEPNDSRNEESVLEIIRVPFDAIKYGEWNDMANGGDPNHGSLESHGFICEWDNTDGTVSHNGRLYKMFDSTTTWKSAKQYCESLGGHLTTITSSEEQEIIENLIGSSSIKAYWLGATDEGHEGDWEWVTDEEWDFTNWDKGEPNNKRGNEHYLHIYTPTAALVDNVIAYSWNDTDNGMTYYSSNGFICEWDDETVVTPAPQITVDKNYAGGNEMIKQAGIDANNLLSNITVGTDKIRGPKISILGKEFYLFELDGKCSLKLGNIKIQFKADEEKNTIQFLGGYDFLSEDVSTGTDYSGRGEWTKAYNDLKSLYGAINNGKLNDGSRGKFGSVYDKLTTGRVKSDIFLNIKGNFAAYGEFAWDNEKPKLVEGGVILKASASGSLDPRIGGIFYGTVGISLDASGKFFLNFDGYKKPLAVNSALNFEPALNVGLGAGTKKFKFYLEGGLKGKLPIDIMAVTGSFADGVSYTPLKVRLQGYLYVSGKMGPLGGDKDWQIGKDLVIYPHDGDISLSSIDDYMEELYTLDKSDFTLLPRDYTNAISLMSLDDEFDKQNLYPYSTPQLANLSGDRKIILWIDDDPSKADADRTSLYYSIYSEGIWSEPKIAAENIGYNDMPQICRDDDNIYIVWTRIDEALGDNTDVDELMSKLNLYYMHFDGEKFGNPELISEDNNGSCEMLYDISENDGVITIAWVENSQNDFSLCEGTNYIYKRSSKDGIWSDKKIIAAEEREIHDLQLDGNGNIIYEAGNGDATELYCENELIGESQNDNSAFQVLNDMVYYLSGSELKTYNINTKESGTTEIGEITDITILDNGNDKIALSLLSTGFTNELYQNEYKDGKWGEWTQLTEYNRYIRDYSAVINDNGKLTAALNLVDVKDEEKGGYGNAELKVVQDLEYSDLILENAYYDGEPTENEAVNICVSITNNSHSTVDSANVNVAAENGDTVYSGNVECNIPPGETKTLTVPVTIPSGFKKQDLTVNVSGDFVENNTANNSAVITLGFANIQIESTRVQKLSDKTVLDGYISNTGFEDADNVTLKIYDSDPAGTLWDTIALDAIPMGEKKEFTFELPEQYLSNTDGKNAIYIEVNTDSEEVATGNNSDRIVMADLTDIENIKEVYMSYDNGILTIKSPKAIGARFIAAYYDNSGRLLACRNAELAIGIGTNNIAIDGLTTGENVKFMLWDNDMTPICDYLDWR